jgi:hypothetical protein
MKYGIILFLLANTVTITGSSYRQNAPVILFKATYLTPSDSDHIKLTAENLSASKTYYYSIGAMGLTDTGWVGLITDINSLGQNDFWGLVTLTPKNKTVKVVSKKRIMRLYAYKNITRIRFSLNYFARKDISSKSERIVLGPM